MLEIKPICDKEEQREITAKCGMDFLPDAFAYKAFEAGNLIACAQFDIVDSAGVIYGMSQVIGTNDDWEAMFILGRAVLNFLDLSTVKTAVYNADDEANVKYAKMIGFKNVDGTFTVSLEGMFTHACEKGLGYNQLNK